MSRDVFNTFPTHTSLCDDVIDTDCLAAPTVGFRNFKKSIFNKLDQKSHGKTAPFFPLLLLLVLRRYADLTQPNFH